MTHPAQLSPSVENLTLTLLPGKPVDRGSLADTAALHDRVFEYWKAFWTRIYADAGARETFRLDDLLRQDLIAAIHKGDELVGTHFYSRFPVQLSAVREHNYFRFFPPEFFEFMKSRGAKVAMSLEFLTVDPKWRKSLTGISFGEILIGCGLNVMKSLGSDVGIGPARTDNKVNEMVYKYGFECFQGGVTRRNFSVDLVAVFADQVRRNPDPVVAAQIDSLWKRRVDHSGLTLPAGAAATERKAA